MDKFTGLEEVKSHGEMFEYQVSFVKYMKKYAVFVQVDELSGYIVDIAPLMKKWKGQSYNKFITWICKNFAEVKVYKLDSIAMKVNNNRAKWDK